MSIIAKYSLNWNANDSSGNGYNWTATEITWKPWIVWHWDWSAGCNWTTSSIVTSTWLNIAITNYTISVWINPSSIPTWSDFWEIIWIFNNSAQYIIWLMLHQQKYYCLQWVWWANWIVQPTTPIPTVNTKELLTIVWNTTAITLYRNWIQIWTAWAWSFTWTINQIKIWNWKYVWLIDEIIIRNNALSPAEVKNEYLFYNWFI